MTTQRIRSLLVANRGEIARRIFRTCHELGITTVAVCSDPDRMAPHVLDADIAIPLGGSTSTDSYLDATKVLRAAELACADAIHPGYGFLSENPEFAEACHAAGLVWIGPSATAIRSMALKVEAKRLVARPACRCSPERPSKAMIPRIGFLVIGGIRTRCDIHWIDDHCYVNAAGWQSDFRFVPRFPATGTESALRGPTAPVPGSVVLVNAELGGAVRAGDLLVIIEAMKMEHRILADHDGVITAVHVAVGESVEAHQVLVEIEV